jgi:hypothetical protein
MTEYDLFLRPCHFKDKHNFLSDPHAIKVTTFAFIFKANFIRPRYFVHVDQGQNRQFADRRGDSTRTMIVDKFYHFHHHRGITLNSDPSWCRAQWANVLYKPTCTKYLGRIKFALKINANVVMFIACGIW